MGQEIKKRFFYKHRKSSALVVSVIIHAIFILVALTFVAVTVIQKDEVDFAAKEVKRPKMKLRKLQVPVKQDKKSQAPKLRKTIVVKTPKQMEIHMPEIVGIRGGGYGTGEGLGGLGFGLDLDMDLFGSDKGAGNDFIGTFYDLKQDEDGDLTQIGRLAEENSFGAEPQRMYREAVNNFVRSGWNVNRLEDFFQAPKKKYARFFNMPAMGADAAPKAYAVDDQVKPSYWLAHYQGTIVARETGRYRFHGLADDVLIVRVGRRVVLDGSWPAHYGTMSSWESRDDNTRRFPVNQRAYGAFKGGDFLEYFDRLRKRLQAGDDFGTILREISIDGQSLEGLGNYMNIANRLVIGDWITLKAGQRVPMEVLVGEIPGGAFGCRLLVEQEGAAYREVESDAGMRKVLPIFKTAPVPDKLMGQMELDPNEMTADGPLFGTQKSE